MEHKHIFIVGGAGFLGYHTSLELAGRGAKVTALAMPNEEADEELSAKVNIARADIDSLSDEDLGKLISGHDTLLYAAGPDDRVELANGVKAADFFGKHLVNRTDRVLKVAKQQGVRKVIIYGSYFSYINNHGLAGLKRGRLERHPYIKARAQQALNGFNLGGEGFMVAVVNIPYVFGVAPGKEPIWRNVFVDRFGKSPKIYYGNGGTTLVSAKKVAFCVAQAVEHAQQGDELPIGSKDMKFKPMIEQLLKEAGIEKPVGSIPGWLAGIFMKREWKKAQKAGLDSGLDLRYLSKDILERDFYVDYIETDRRLRMSDYVDDVDKAIAETGERIKQ